MLIEAPPTRYEIYPKFICAEEDAKQLDPQKLADIMDAWSGGKLLSFSKDIDIGNNAESLVGGSIVNENYFQHQQQQ
jgi:hypothetical protein